jgi:hypothetical protein
VPAAAPPDLPLQETVAQAVLVAGWSGLPEGVYDGTPVHRAERFSLVRSGVRRSDGSAVVLAATAHRNRRFAAVETCNLPASRQHIPGLAIFGGVIGPAFGHQITQSIGRLWAGALAPKAPILFLPERLSFRSIPRHVLDLARALGVQNDLHLVTEPAQCEQLLVPAEVCNLDFRPCTTPYFRDWLARNRPEPPPEPGPDLYVSRSGLPLDNGQYLQENLLETALQRSDYRVIHPERLTIAEQLAAYRAARRLIFADGSAAHLWSFAARPGQKVAIVLRRQRDRKFARWFRSFDAAPPAYLDHGLADFWRRGEGPSRSLSLLDLQGLWQSLREGGYHDDPASLGPARATVEAWLAVLPLPRFSMTLSPPFDLDQRSLELMALRSRCARRPGSFAPPTGTDP